MISARKGSIKIGKPTPVAYMVDNVSWHLLLIVCIYS